MLSDTFRPNTIGTPYQIDNKAERALNRQVVNIRSEYLKEHGVALTELDMSTYKIKKAYAGHEHKWKFYQNLNQIKDTILKTGQLPADYQERLERKPTIEEIQANKESYRASRKQSTREPANKLVNENSGAKGETNSQDRDVKQKASQEKSFDKSDYCKSDDNKGFDPSEGSGGSGGSRIAAGLSMLQNFLNGISDGAGSGKDVEWGERPKKKHKAKEQHNNQEYSL